MWSRTVAGGGVSDAHVSAGHHTTPFSSQTVTLDEEADQHGVRSTVPRVLPWLPSKVRFIPKAS